MCLFFGLEMWDNVFFSLGWRCGIMCLFFGLEMWDNVFVLWAGVELEMFSTEQELENASLHEPSSFVGVVFLDGMSYQLRFPYSELPLPSDYTESFGSPITTKPTPKYCQNHIVTLPQQFLHFRLLADTFNPNRFTSA